MNIFSTSKKGFTLIELLVVIAIIGLLSSVVLASLNSARIKARDASIRSSVIQIRNVVENVRDDHGSYADIQSSGYWSNGEGATSASKYSCSTLGPPVAPGVRIYGNLTATEATEIQKLCENIVVLSSGSKVATNASANYVVRINTTSTSNNYSIMARLASGGMFCLGSSGQSSITGTTGFFGTDPALASSAGCSGNP